MTSRTEAQARKAACCGPAGCGLAPMGQLGEWQNQELIRVCIASICMAWRWDEPGHIEPDRKWGMRHYETYDPATGYCGFAGKP